MAPELLDTKSGFSEKVDVYAFGILLNEMIGRRIPFDGVADSEIKRRVINGDRPEVSLSCDRRLHDLIVKCWSQDPEERPTFIEIHDLLHEHVRSVPA